MGAQAQFLLQASTYFTSSFSSSSSSSISHSNVITNKSNIKYSINISTCCSSRSRSNWDTTASGNGRFRFNFEDDLYTEDGYDDDFSAKPRNWWSDYNYDYDYEDDSEFDEEEDESWILKIFKAFGWMLPAIAIPWLLGTAPNALFMALIPLGQSVLSLAFDKLWGRTGSIPKSRPRTRRKEKPFAKAASSSKTSQSKQENKAANGRRSYQSWVVADGVSYEKRDKSGSRFGGWDDLDKKGENHGYRAARKPPSQIKSERPKQQKKVIKEIEQLVQIGD
ncbi:uncharacterized protein LOC102626604 isoform X2 [Citrus sinensis]|uniref:uncharacterized protein LOC102626604 isoform X2 n=1 Tax=Citrus sinensis TaxID=2711 RepID=UPI002279760F|nr:uncharacterized protein LOC102626604 isoform X2 [Citrus sinensis]